jgi:molybdenum cofactor cytidylyltransferase
MMPVYVVLAAGGSTRMGFPKPTTPLAGTSPLARLAETLAGRRVVIVTRAELSLACSAIAPSAEILINPHPEQGMSRSLKIAGAAVPQTETLGVLLADTPLIGPSTLLDLEARLQADDWDVCYPVSREGRAGHPVYFGPSARQRLAGLPDGDTLRLLRDEPRLRTCRVPCEDPGAFLDLDSPQAWAAAEARLQTLSQVVHLRDRIL